MLEEKPFSSCRVLCRHFRIGKVADPSGQVWLKNHILARAHSLSINRTSERVSYSKLLLTALIEQKANGLDRIISPGWFMVLLRLFL
jgi:hypothetical protein